MNSAITSRTHRKRKASALLLCTLAAAVLSMAGIAILRSSQRGVARVEALRSASVGQHVADGLLQRSIAVLRVNPTTTGRINDPGAGMPGAYSEIQKVGGKTTRIRVFMYVGSTVPAIDIVVDTDKIGGKKPKKPKPPKKPRGGKPAK